MPLSARRRRWFRLSAIVAVPLLVLLCAEGVLRLAGYGYSPHFFIKQAVGGREVWTDNQDFGRRFFPPGLVRGSRPLSLAPNKEANTLRIFVLGESAAMGDPDFKFGLPRMLEVLLRERFPQRRIEVINAAVVAINSHVILPIARDCARQQAVLWVIYMGNNEMIGPFGSASVFGSQAPALFLVRAGLWLKAARLGQLIEAALYWLRYRHGGLPEWGGMEMMANQKVRFDAPATTRVYDHFEQNLKDVLAAAGGARVPVLLCTVATNLKDCAPFASLHRAGLASADLSEWQTAYKAGEAAEAVGNVTNAARAYERAAQIDAGYADLAYHRAECARLLGQDSQALELFRQARDEDALQFRADRQINEIIRRTAAAFADRRVSLLDAEKLLGDNSPQGLGGAEYFYEHVHLTPEGNYLLARALTEQAVKVLSLETAGEWLSQSECLRRLGLMDWNRYDALNVILDRIQAAPFTSQLNHRQQLETINQQLARYRLATKPAQVRQEAAQVSRLVERRPDDPDLNWNLAVLLENAGDNAGAEKQWRTVIKLQPQFSLPDYNLAKLLEFVGRQQEALPFYLECLRLNPEYYPARYAVGAIYLQAGQAAEAILHLKRAVWQKPGSIEARLALGQALAVERHPAEAQKQWREVLRLDPTNATALERLRNQAAER